MSATEAEEQEYLWPQIAEDFDNFAYAKHRRTLHLAKDGEPLCLEVENGGDHPEVDEWKTGSVESFPAGYRKVCDICLTEWTGILWYDPY